MQEKNTCFSKTISLHESNKETITLNWVFIFQFNYYPLAQMCHSRTLNNRIKTLHERFLRVIDNDKKSTFQKLLDKNKSVPERNV